MKFASARLIAADLGRMVSFYEMVTGQAARWLAPVFAEIVTPAATLAIGAAETVAQWQEGSAEPASNRTACLEFQVEDVEAEYARLKDKVTLVHGLKQERNQIMSTYAFVRIRHVADRASMERYSEAVPPTFAGTGVKPLSIYLDLRHVEGVGPVDGIVLLEFPDMETANRWYESPAYQAIRHHRTEGADSEIFFFDSGVLTDLTEAMLHTKGRVKAGHSRPVSPDAADSRLAHPACFVSQPVNEPRVAANLSGSFF